MSLSCVVHGAQIRIFRDSTPSGPPTIAGRTYANVQVRRAAPLSDPEHFISVIDTNGDEIWMIKDPSELDEETRRVLSEELGRQDRTLTIRRINSTRIESGTSCLDVETDRGRREFALQDVNESVRRLSGGRLLLHDVDGNRFEIPDVRALDRRSAKLLERIV